jgi:hypothetical protein
VTAGIFTFHRAHNYGAMLQSYALKYICEHLGHETFIVDYQPEYIESQYLYFNFKGNLKEKLLKLYNVRGNIEKKKKFNSFMNSYLGLSPYSQDVREYDFFIYGSDQIWNPDIKGSFDPVYFGEHDLAGKKHVSYAASIGKPQLDNAEKEQFSKLINRIDKISVREKTAKRIVNMLTGKNVDVVLDPTLLLNREEWGQIARYPRLNGRYLLVYEVVKYPETMRLAKKVAKQLNLKIVEIIYARTKPFSDHIRINDAGPVEFLGWFGNADYVITSSFHGTAFSIINRKNFYTIPHRYSGSRMADLLTEIGLEDRLAANVDLLDEICDVDYSLTEARLEQKKEESIGFLKTALV